MPSMPKIPPSGQETLTTSKYEIFSSRNLAISKTNYRKCCNIKFHFENETQNLFVYKFLVFAHYYPHVHMLDTKGVRVTPTMVCGEVDRKMKAHNFYITCSPTLFCDLHCRGFCACGAVKVSQREL